MVSKIFVNLPIRDLKKTIGFFTKLGFRFDPRFTDENATCMVVGKDIFVMLLVEKFFRGFIPGKDVPDTSKTSEVLMALTAESRKEVDEMIAKVVAAGGKEYREPSDHGWMYGRAFQDLDGHIWEVFHMDESKMPEEMKNKGE